MTDACSDKGDKGSDKHRRRKSKVTFAQLLEKYQKMSEAKRAYRPAEAKASKSPPERKSDDMDWQKKKPNVPTP